MWHFPVGYVVSYADVCHSGTVLLCCQGREYPQYFVVFAVREDGLVRRG